MGLIINTPRYGNVFVTTDTFNDLRTVGSPYIVDGYSALVKGAGSAADGLGGMYVWNSSSTDQDDDDQTIAPTDGSTGRWKRITFGVDNGGNVAATLAQLKAAATGKDSIIYNQATYRWTLGDYTGQADDLNIVASDVLPITTGAWVRQSATSLNFKAASGSKVRSISSRLRESVSLADYWTPGDSLAALPTAFASAYSDGRYLEIPKSFDGMSIGALDHLIPANKGLIVGARLIGTDTNATIKAATAGTTEVFFEGGHFENVVLQIGGGTPRIYNFSGSGRTNVAAILIRSPLGAVTTNMVIDGIDITGANYGILKDADLGTAYNTQITNGRFYDLYGDAIELNVIPLDRNTQITNHTIDLIGNPPGSPNPNWGLGIGVSNGFDVRIFNIVLSRQRQGIHVEYSNRVEIADIIGQDVTTVYSPATTTESGGVFTYGSDQLYIHGIRGIMDVNVYYGALDGGYNNPPKNVTIRDVVLAGGNLAVNLGQDGNAASYGIIEDVYLNNGQFRVDERPSFLKLNNVYARRARGNGLAMMLNTDLNRDGRQAFRAPAASSTAIVKNCVGVDEYGAQSVGYIRNSDGQIIGGGTVQFVQASIDASGNNFGITTGPSIKRINREFVGDYGGAFPYGTEFVENDLVIDTNATTPARYVVTAAGSRTRAGDTFEISDKPNRTIKSTAPLPWSDPNQHSPGQAVALSNVGPSGGTLYTTVVQTYVSGSFYYMQVSDDFTPTTGTGTITSTNTVAWVTV